MLVAEVIKDSLSATELSPTISPYLLSMVLSSVKEGIEVSKQIFAIRVIGTEPGRRAS